MKLRLWLLSLCAAASLSASQQGYAVFAVEVKQETVQVAKSSLENLEEAIWLNDVYTASDLLQRLDEKSLNMRNEYGSNRVLDALYYANYTFWDQNFETLCKVVLTKLLANSLVELSSYELRRLQNNEMNSCMPLPINPSELEGLLAIYRLNHPSIWAKMKKAVGSSAAGAVVAGGLLGAAVAFVAPDIANEFVHSLRADL